MGKQVQIDIDLFKELYDYFCTDKETDIDYIRTNLQLKHDALVRRAMYSLSKNESMSQEQRDYFRKEYERLSYK